MLPIVGSRPQSAYYKMGLCSWTQCMMLGIVICFSALCYLLRLGGGYLCRGKSSSNIITVMQLNQVLPMRPVSQGLTWVHRTEYLGACALKGNASLLPSVMWLPASTRQQQASNALSLAWRHGTNFPSHLFFLPTKWCHGDMGETRVYVEMPVKYLLLSYR